MGVLNGNIRDEAGNPVIGALVYVYNSIGVLADLEDALAAPIENPLTTNIDGFYEAYVEGGVYSIAVTYGGRIRYREGRILVGPVATVDVVVGAFGELLFANNTQAEALTDLGLSASGGSALVGFLQAGTGATARTAQAKLREVVSALDFGAVGDDATNNSAAFALIKTAAEAGTIIHFPKGTYRSSTPLLFNTKARITADPGTRLKATASMAAVMQFDYTGGGPFFAHGGYAENFILDGNSFATDGLSLKGVISAQFPNIQATNVTQAGLHLHWAQLCLFSDFICSDNVENFTTTPVNGILADTASNSANTFINPTIEKVSGDGIKGISLLNSVLINGTSEGNTGAGIRLGESPAATLVASGNTVLGMDLEVNTGGDVICEDSAGSNEFYSLKAGFDTPAPSIRIKNGSTRNYFSSGVVGDIDVDSGAVDTVFDSVSILGTGGTITDAGTRTKWCNIRNITDNTIIVDSANPYFNEVTIAGAGTYNINAKLNRQHWIFASGATLTIAAPTNPQPGQLLTITISNTSGGALTTTWNAVFRTNGIVDPANGSNRTYTFVYGANFSRWYLASMSPADVAN